MELKKDGFNPKKGDQPWNQALQGLAHVKAKILLPWPTNVHFGSGILERVWPPLQALVRWCEWVLHVLASVSASFPKINSCASCLGRLAEVKANRALTCAYNFILCSSTSISCHNGCKISLVSQSRHYKRSSLDKEVASVCILQFFNSCNLSVLLEMTTDVTTLHSILVGHVSAE